MNKTTEQAEILSNAQIETRLGNIEAQLQAIATHLDAPLQTAKKSAEAAPASIKKPENNKGLLAFLFGAIGMKVGAVLGAKIGIFGDMFNYFGNGADKTAKMLADTKDSAEMMKGMMKLSRFTVIGTGVGAVLGTIGGAWLGIKRGDRIEHAEDLIKHPLNSIKILMASEDSAKTKPENTETQSNPVRLSKDSYQGRLTAAAVEKTI